MISNQPRHTIPDAWAQIAACPICNTRGLMVAHIPGQPDQLNCMECHVSFEMEMNGPNIRMMVLPSKHIDILHPAWQIWMSVFEIHRQIKAGLLQETQDLTSPLSIPEISSLKRPVPFSPLPTDPLSAGFDDFLPTEPLSQEEVINRAEGLAALGNNQKEIRKAMERLSATPEQIDLALAKIAAKKSIQKSDTPRTIIMVLIGIILCLGISALILPMLDIPRYIGKFLPIWSTLQKSSTETDIYGGLSKSRSTPDGSPVAEIPVLPEDGNAYFSVIWKINEKNTWNEKYLSVAELTPPVGLGTIHRDIVDHFFFVAVLEASSNGDSVTYDALCGSPGEVFNDRCPKLDQSQIILYQQFVSERDNLYDWWITTPCDSFQDYYAAAGVPWPFGKGLCSYP